MRLKENLMEEVDRGLLSVEREVRGNHAQSPGTDYPWGEHPLRSTKAPGIPARAACRSRLRVLTEGWAESWFPAFWARESLDVPGFGLFPIPGRLSLVTASLLICTMVAVPHWARDTPPTLVSLAH